MPAVRRQRQPNLRHRQNPHLLRVRSCSPSVCVRRWGRWLVASDRGAAGRQRRSEASGQGPGGPPKGTPPCGKAKPGCPRCKPGAPCPQCKAAKVLGRGPGGPGKAFGRFGFGRAFGGPLSGRGPRRPMGFLRGRFGGRLALAMRLRAHRAGSGRPGLPFRGSRFGRGRGLWRSRPGMHGPHRRGPVKGGHGPLRREHGKGPQGRHGHKGGGHR